MHEIYLQLGIWRKLKNLAYLENEVTVCFFLSLLRRDFTYTWTPSQYNVYTIQMKSKMHHCNNIFECLDKDCYQKVKVNKYSFNEKVVFSHLILLVLR